MLLPQGSVPSVTPSSCIRDFYYCNYVPPTEGGGGGGNIVFGVDPVGVASASASALLRFRTLSFELMDGF